MVAPFTPYPIKGFLWYQGETDSASDRVNLYAKLLPTLIADWRRQWGQGNLPFLIVQISSFDSQPENWGLIRDSQRRTLDVANTRDGRDSRYWPTRQRAPARQANSRRPPGPRRPGAAYGETGLECSGPLYRQTTRGRERPGNLVRSRGGFAQQQGTSSKGLR